MANRAKVVIDTDGADQAIVTIAGADVFPTRVSAVAETFPQTLTTATTFFADTDPDVSTELTISILVNNLEMSKYATSPLRFNRDDRYVVKPEWHMAARRAFEDTEINLGSPAVGAATAVHAAVTSTAVQQIVTTGITNPDVPRNVTATSGGTAADIKPIQVIVAGTNWAGQAITETLPVFTENSATTVVGSKAFRTVTSITIPAHDGLGATTAIGTGAKLGLPHTMTRNLVERTFLNGVLEGTAATVVFDADEIEKNTVTLNSTLAGTAVIVELN